MYTLYSILILMLALALSLLAIPFIKNRANFPLYSLIIFFSIIFTFTCYQLSGNHPALNQWLSKGQEHYQLQTDIEKLGGIDGIITRIQQKLANNPDDAKGWLILGKLYQDKHDYTAAKKAFQKANQLDSKI
jgi:cytochrome c-type biogenesis protein CcmH/NrfG